MGHTPTPWHCSTYDGGWDCVRDGHNQIIAKLGLNMPNNAEFIVKAVNSHDDLVAALERILDAASHGHEEDNDILLEAISNAAAAALAKVQP